jgi:hypothetical protein
MIRRAWPYPPISSSDLSEIGLSDGWGRVPIRRSLSEPNANASAKGKAKKGTILCGILNQTSTIDTPILRKKNHRIKAKVKRASKS